MKTKLKKEVELIISMSTAYLMGDLDEKTYISNLSLYAEIMRKENSNDETEIYTK